MPARRQPFRRVRIKPEPVADNQQENVPPPPPLPQSFGSSTPSTAVQILDAVFQRVIEPEHLLTPSQKTYMEEQLEALDDEKYIFQHIVGDARDLLNSIHHFELRHQPDQNVPLFFEVNH